MATGLDLAGCNLTKAEKNNSFKFALKGTERKFFKSCLFLYNAYVDYLKLKTKQRSTVWFRIRKKPGHLAVKTAEVSSELDICSNLNTPLSANRLVQL